MKKSLLSIGLIALSLAIGCTAAGSPGTTGAAPTPTPSASAVARVNPYVVEETDTYTIQRYPKDEYIRIDDRHIRHPILGVRIEFFREDEKYYYVSVPKHIAEEQALRQAQGVQPTKRPADVRRPEDSTRPAPALSDFTDLLPPRAPARVRLEKVQGSGLPAEGLWRASFEVADMNEDGIPDVIAPPSRIGGIPYLQIWTGDGKGKFSPWKIAWTEAGIEKPDAGIDYGGVAVGDIDGDGHQDVATASHGGGLRSFFGDGKGNFRIVRTGLPGADFSAQAVVLIDVNKDRRLDMVASRDVIETTGAVDKQQVRVYVNQGDRWQFHDGLNGGFYSNTLRAWDYDGDGLKDVLTGSHYNGALTLLWKNGGDANFSPVSFPDIEIYAFHFGTAPGTLGKDRAPAFADAYYMSMSDPQVAKAGGITLYAFRGGAWTRHRMWRHKDAKTLLYAVAMGDLDGDGLDDVVFPDSDERRLKLFFQKPDGTFSEAEQSAEPALDSPGQCVRLADLDKDGRLDVVLSKTSTSAKPDDVGGWDVYLNRR